MKAKEVLKILKITRPTLTHYVKSGRLKALRLPNGMYDYDEDSVLKCARRKKKITLIKEDLENEIGL